jgi:predicted aspartyl protease
LGFVKTRVKVSNPSNPSKKAELELLVDTVATFTLISSAVFQEIGVQADGKFKLKTADSKFIGRDGSMVWVEVEGKGYKVPVIVGDEEDAPVLGVTTLEILGLELDPITKKLKPTKYLLLYQL